MTSLRPIFLTAKWRHLVMLNYEVDPQLLGPYVPVGTTLDAWQGHHYISIVAFRFLDTRVRGIPIPLHRNFEEINLRFYVGRKGSEGWRRGVVFIREVVPRWAIAAVARWVYNENYVWSRTTSSVTLPGSGESGQFRYTWQPKGLGELAVEASVIGAPKPWQPGSAEEFITEHYWGYARQRDGGTVEYRVEHPPWEIWPAQRAALTDPAASFYGSPWTDVLSTEPSSAFVATGSPVAVHRGERIR